jgi:hypothetical protein
MCLFLRANLFKVGQPNLSRADGLKHIHSEEPRNPLQVEVEALAWTKFHLLPFVSNSNRQYRLLWQALRIGNRNVHQK